MTLRIFKYYHLKYASYLIFFLGEFFGGRIAVNGIALFILISIIGFFTEGINIRKFNKLLLIPIIFYILHFISVFYSSNKSQAWFDLEVKLSFLLLPLLFGLEKKNKNITLETILLLFSSASVFAAIYLLSNSISIYLKSGIFPVYISFSPFIHVSYLTAYFTFNLFVNIYLLRKKSTLIVSIIKYLSIFLSLPVIYFAQSKAGLIIFILLISFMLFLRLYEKYKVESILISAILLLTLANIIITTPRFKSIMYGYQHFKGIVSGKKEYVESTAERLMTWDASVKLLKDNYRFGMGNGDVRDALSEKYFELGYEKPAMLRLNSHNQYLETFLTIGIPGFITLLIMLFAPVLFSKGPYDFLIKTFIFIIAVNFLFESMLNTQAGVIFFFFFYSLLISYNRNKPQHKPVITEEDYL